jgi:hypothetical protein
MMERSTGYLLATGLLGLLGGCADNPSDARDANGEIACGYYLERGMYSLVNVNFVDLNAETTWAAGLTVSRHMRNPAGEFAWMPLAQGTLLDRHVDSNGGLGSVSTDPRCFETQDLFSKIESIANDSEGFKYIEQRAELSIVPLGFQFPSTLAEAEAIPESQNVPVRIVADLTRDKIKTELGGEVRRPISKQTIALSATCSDGHRLTRRWVPKIERDDPAFCRPVGTTSECVQFNLEFSAENCKVDAGPLTLQLASGSSQVSIGGALTRGNPGEYVLRVDDIRLLPNAH